jgi:hypothetical protein
MIQPHPNAMLTLYRADKISLCELLLKLHRNDPVPPSLVTTIAKHAAILGESIINDYNTLKNIVLRHEALIRKRWLKKTTIQRRHILLAAWPNMSEMHRPDYVEEMDRLMQAMSTNDKSKLPSDACTWPYINLEDLTKPRSLLIYLTFQGSERTLDVRSF